MIGIKLEGVKELEKEIRELDGNLHKANLKGLKKAAKQITNKANATAKSKGFSQRKYYTVLGEAKSLKASEGSAGVKVGTKEIKGLHAPKKNRVKYYKEMKDYFYMRFVEFGTKKQRPQKILSDAIKSEESNIQSSVKEALDNMLNKLRGILKGK